MHILEIAPPWYAIPPARYGGIERVIDDLTQSFLDDGHSVTLLAPGDSTTKATLIPICERGLGLDMSAGEKAELARAASTLAFRIARTLNVDIVHDHTDHVVGAWDDLPIVKTLHGAATPAVVRRCAQMSRHGDHLVAISNSQRQLYDCLAQQELSRDSALNFASVIHNPINVAGTPFYGSAEKDNYLAFVGRCHWEKGPEIAIAVARLSGMPLKMAMRISADERTYFEQVIRPLLEAHRGLVEFVGEVGGLERDELIGRAKALLFTPRWDEPFGLVMTEALARGTPVVTFARGSAPELIQDGVTGIVCNDQYEMVRRLPEAMAIDPAVCRARAFRLFDRTIIARQHLELFESLLDVPFPRQQSNFMESQAASSKMTLVPAADFETIGSLVEMDIGAEAL